MSSVAQNQYQSSEGVLVGICLAHSTFYNSRGLEFPWNAPFHKAFSEILRPYLDNGSMLINSPYTIWSPAFRKEEQEVKEELDRLGIDYEAQLPRKLTLRKLTILVNRLLEVESNSSMKVEDIAERIEDLLEARADIIEKAKTWAEAQKQAKSKNFFDNTLDSEETGAAFEKIPDIVITCVGSINCPPSSSKQEQVQRDLSGGKKSYHERITVLIELKRGGDRWSAEDAYMDETTENLWTATLQLREYCSAYFASLSDREKRRDNLGLVVIAAAGQYWNWAYISEKDCPPWDFALSSSVDQDRDDWYNMFDSDGPFCLGMPVSDANLVKLETEFITPIRQSIPPPPLHLQQALQKALLGEVMEEDQLLEEESQDKASIQFL